MRSTAATMMRALVRDGFGAADDVLALREIARPTPDADDVLIGVRAASIHIGDVYGIWGLPKAMRPVYRSMSAKNGVVGTDIAGTVEAVGREVVAFRPGDDVFGSCKGAFADYAVTKAESIAIRPASISCLHAAAIGVSAFTALQALRDHGRLRAGQRVLITGASGGVGTFAVQIATSIGAHVTGVCSTRNVEMVRSIGADEVIDYTRDDYTRGGPKYDLVLDNIGDHSLRDTRRVLTAGGMLLPNGSAAPRGWFGGLGHPLKAGIVSMFVGQQGRPFVSKANEQDLATLTELAATGEVVPVIDRIVPLDAAVNAIDHVGKGHAQGTSVITVSEPIES